MEPALQLQIPLRALKGGAEVVWWGLFQWWRNLRDNTPKSFRRQLDSGDRQGKTQRRESKWVFPLWCLERMEGKV